MPIQPPPLERKEQDRNTGDFTPIPGSVDGLASLVLHHAERFAGTFSLEHEEITIGSAPDNGLVLESPSVSPRHAIIRKKSDRWVIEDTGSVNGIQFRGERRARLAFRPGDEVVIGVFRLTYVRGDESVAPADKRPPDRAPSTPPPLPSKREWIAAIDFGGVTYELKDAHFNIGSDASAHLRISGLFIAPHHAQISRRPDGTYRIVHGAGRSALKVNGQETKVASLHEGDVISIGKNQLRFIFSRG